MRLEALRVGGASLDALAERFGVSRDSVHRHFKKHVSSERRAELMAGPAKIAELANAAADESRSLLDELRITRSVLFNQFIACAEVGDRTGVANLAGKLLDAFRDLGRLTGELREIAGISVTNNFAFFADPRMLDLQNGLVKIAREHPGARAAILTLLRDLDGKAAAPRAAPAAPMIDAEPVYVA